MLKLYIKSKMALTELKENVEGASLIEYSLLIGLIAAALVAIIGTMSGTILGIWTDLNTIMAPPPAA